MDNVQTNNKSYLIFSNFILKILALLTMTIDHIGYMLQSNYIGPEALGYSFRIIGRLALPLFCFMIVEGVLHTRNFKKYCLRLGIALLCVAGALLFVEYIPLFDGFSVRNEGNIFVDLLLGAVAVYFLNDKRWWVKLLALLPIGYAVGSSFAMMYECVQCGSEVWIVPFFIRTQYSFYGILLIVGFYCANLLGDLYIKIVTKDSFKGTIYERTAKNILAIALLVFINLLFYFAIDYRVIDPALVNYMDIDLQILSCLAGIFIFFYSGKRGYGASWFKYGCYLYYAIHMIIVYGLFAIIC